MRPFAVAKEILERKWSIFLLALALYPVVQRHGEILGNCPYRHARRVCKKLRDWEFS